MATDLEKEREKTDLKEQKKQTAKEICKNTLRKEAYIMVNKKLIKILGGTDAPILLGELLSKESYFEQKDQLEDGWFFLTEEVREENTGLNRFLQKKAIETLEKIGIISTINQGLPRKKYFKINHVILLEILSKKE